MLNHIYILKTNSMDQDSFNTLLDLMSQYSMQDFFSPIFSNIEQINVGGKESGIGRAVCQGMMQYSGNKTCHYISPPLHSTGP